MTDDYEKALEIADGNGGHLNLALELLNNASEAGDERARYALASWYLNGTKVVNKDEEKGRKLLKSLQQSLIAEANYDLGVMYDLGSGCRRNSKKAFEFYMKAALLGDCQACSQIAEFFRTGEVVQRSQVLAESWQKRSNQAEDTISPPYRLWLRQ